MHLRLDHVFDVVFVAVGADAQADARRLRKHKVFLILRGDHRRHYHSVRASTETTEKQAGEEARRGAIVFCRGLLGSVI